MALQKRLQLFQKGQLCPVGDRTGGIEAPGGIGPTKIEQAEAGPVRLLGVCSVRQLLTDPAQNLRTDVVCPVFQAPRF